MFGGVRRAVCRGLAKTFVGWQRYVRDAVAERNSLLAKGMAMLSGGTRYKCFVAWRGAALDARDQRDALLREQLLKNGSLQCVKVVRAWFDWRTARLAAKHRVGWAVSPAGCAFRAWLSLIDQKRRREFLEWALGPDMSMIQGKLKTATKAMTEDFDDQLGEVRESVEGLRKALRQEVSIEKKAVRELLDGKMDKTQADGHRQAIEQTSVEVDALREQLASQAETQRSLSLESERGVHELHEQLATLSREVEDRVAQTHKALDKRVGQEEKALGAVSEEIATIKSTKANHDELVKLVSKLQHRPKPGVPMGVHQLLAVPYPMPPGQMRTSSPRNRSRPQSAARGSGQSSTGSLPHMQPGGGVAELREVPTAVPDDPRHQPYLATSEQVLVRPLPADAIPPPRGRYDAPFGGAGSASGGRLAGTRQLVPPSSHTPALSARASSTVNAILSQRRPASARSSGPNTQVNMFASRTERLERSLGHRGGEAAAEARPDMV